MTGEQVSTAVTEVKNTSEVILGILAQVDPKTAHDDAVADNILELVTEMATKAIAAYVAAAGTEITPDTILALMPDQTPLLPPKSAA